MSRSPASDLPPDPLHALALRRWVLTALASGRGAAPVDDDAGSRISAASWGLFLAVERCAAPLAERVPAVTDGLSAAVREVVAEAARGEIARILAARAQLRTLAAVARRLGCRPVLLKGGVALAAGGPAYDLDDLDLLLPAGEAAAFAEALDTEGYRPLVGSGSYRHLAVRAAPGALHVEIHVPEALDGDTIHGTALEDVRPVADFAELGRPAPLWHAWNVLVHVTVDHTDRRGRIRDVLLLADAVGECVPDERDMLHRRAAAHPAGTVMAGQLAMAQAVRAGDGPVEAFAGIALTNYVLRCRTGGVLHLPGNLPVTASNLVFAVLGGSSERRRFWARETSIPMEPSRFRFIAEVQRRWPRLGRLWLLFFRLLRLPVALTVAAPHVRAVRRALRQAGLGPRVA